MPRHIQPADRAATEAVAARVRVFLEPRWLEWRETRQRPAEATASGGMCRFTSVFLAKVLAAESDARWTVRGGSPVAEAHQLQLRWERGAPRDGGMLDAVGRWQAHYWVEDLAGSTLVDLTADQFGHEPVVISAPGDQRYSGNFLAHAVRGHLGDALITPRAWLRAWRAEATPGAAPAPR